MRSVHARAALRRHARPLFVSWALSALAVTRASAAQNATSAEPDLATRRMLIAQAQQARADGDHRLALARAEQAQRIQSTPSLRLFVAQELLALERPADAMVQGESCMREAERDASVPNRETLIVACRQLVLDTRSSLGTVTVSVLGTRPSGLTIVVASRAVDESLIGVPVAVNPGNINVEVRAAGYRVARRTIDVRRGGSEEVTVELEREPLTSVSTARPAARPISLPTPRATSPERAHVPIAPIVLMSVGAAALGASAVTFALRQDAISACSIEADRFVCENTANATMLVSRADEAEALTSATQGLLISGAVTAVGGAVWFAIDRASTRSSDRSLVTVRPLVGATRGLVVEGAF
ncbi:MAG: hypothetical protein U0269_19895 [Polyangiales bacterium]